MQLRVAATSAVLLLPLLIGAPAKAEDINFSAISCSDFVSDSKDDAILLLTWLEGYFTKKDAPPVMSAQKATEHARDIRDYCLNHGQDDLFKAAKAVIK